MKINDINIGTRHRQDLGDIDGLAESMRALGLLHPVVIDMDCNLIAGERRLTAAKKLGWKEIPVTIATTISGAAKALKAERDENRCRKDFAPTEAASLADQLEALEKPKAAERMKATQAKPGARVGSVKFPEPTDEDSGDTRDKVAEAVGMSAPTLQKVRTVIDAAKADPVHYGDLPKKMDATGKVDPVFKEAQRRAEEHPVESVPKLIPRSKSAGERFYGTLAGLHREFIALRENGGMVRLSESWTDEERNDYARQLESLANDALKWAGEWRKKQCRKSA